MTKKIIGVVAILAVAGVMAGETVVPGVNSGREPPPLWSDPVVVRYIEGLKSLSESERYVYGLANTLQWLVSAYVWSEGRIPTREEFLESPYNLLLPEAMINPYSGKPILWTETPVEGNLYYRMPANERDFLLIVPWITRFPGLAFEKDRYAGRGARLGIFGVYPGPMVLWPTPELAEQIRRECAEVYSPHTHYCWMRVHKFEAKGYNRTEWMAYVLSDAVGLANRVYQALGEGMPGSLKEMQERYWWFYNTRFRNPFTGAPVREVSFREPSPGDVTIAVSVFQKDLLMDPLSYGVGGRRLHPYEYEGEFIDVTLDNLGRFEYVTGLEGQSFCGLWREMDPEMRTRRYYDLSCPAHDKVFLTSPPRFAPGEVH